MDGIVAGQLTALIGLAGVIVGAAIGLVSGWLIAGREARLRVAEKIVDRRIQAYETLADIAREMRETSLPAEDLNPTIEDRIPAVLVHNHQLDAWRIRFAERVGGMHHWLEDPARREVFLVQDYVINLAEILKRSAGDRQEIARAARDDFVDFAKNLEQLATEWFARRAHKIKYKKPGWHKYPIEETHRRLNQTAVLDGFGERIPVRTQSPDGVAR